MHCVAALEPAGADALTGADATAPFEPSIVAVAISPATSPSTVFARLSAWTWDMMGVAGVVVCFLLSGASRGRDTGAPSRMRGNWMVWSGYPPIMIRRHGSV